MPQDTRPRPEATSELVESVFHPAAWSQVVLYLRLTERQAEVARGLLLGEKEFTIADRLGISVHTVHNHRRRLYAKLDAHDYASGIRRLLSAALAVVEKGGIASRKITERQVDGCREEDEGTIGSA